MARPLPLVLKPSRKTFSLPATLPARSMPFPTEAIPASSVSMPDTLLCHCVHAGLTCGPNRASTPPPAYCGDGCACSEASWSCNCFFSPVMTISLAWLLACAGRPSSQPIWDGNSPVNRCCCPALSAAHHWLASAGLAPSGSIARSNDPASRSAPRNCEAAAGLAPANFPSSTSLAVICVSTSSATDSARATRSATSPAAGDGAWTRSDAGPAPESSGGAGSADTPPPAPTVSLFWAARSLPARSTDCASPIPLAASRSNDALLGGLPERAPADLQRPAAPRRCISHGALRPLARLPPVIVYHTSRAANPGEAGRPRLTGRNAGGPAACMASKPPARRPAATRRHPGRSGYRSLRPPDRPQCWRGSPGSAAARPRAGLSRGHVKSEVGGRDAVQGQDAGAADQTRARLTGRWGSENQQHQSERETDRHYGGCGEPLDHGSAPCVRNRRESPGPVRTRCAAHANGTSDQPTDTKSRQ